MNAEQKCVSLETAKRLKENGFPQDTERWWVLDGKGEDGWSLLHEIYLTAGSNDKSVFEHIAAPDAAELGEWMPYFLGAYRLTITRSFKTKEWFVSYRRKNTRIGERSVEGVQPRTTRNRHQNRHESLAEAMGACWLYLKSQNLV